MPIPLFIFSARIEPRVAKPRRCERCDAGSHSAFCIRPRFHSETIAGFIGKLFDNNSKVQKASVLPLDECRRAPHVLCIWLARILPKVILGIGITSILPSITLPQKVLTLVQGGITARYQKVLPSVIPGMGITGYYPRITIDFTHFTMGKNQIDGFSAVTPGRFPTSPFRERVRRARSLNSSQREYIPAWQNERYPSWIHPS